MWWFFHLYSCPSLMEGNIEEQVRGTGPLSGWTRFWKWYENKILGSIMIIAIIQFVQVPHMI